MTIVRVNEDHPVDFEKISDHEFKEFQYFHEEECRTRSSSMLGKYCKIITYHAEIDLTRLWDSLYRGSHPIDFFDIVKKEWDAEVVATDVDHNKGYDPDTYRKLFEEKARAYAKLEKETGMRLY